MEHMLFMGSEEFPTENEYDEFLTRHGGFSNAFTDLVRSLHWAGILATFVCFGTVGIVTASEIRESG